MIDTEGTIAAIATAPGRGGIGIVRLSGPSVEAIARGVIGKLPRAREAVYRAFVDAQGVTLDRGLALHFPAPHSYTGEDVLELHAHGGPVVLDMLLARVLELGARVARPGEFTLRAYLNNKIDLAQAEAVADLIDSASSAAARCAVRALEGALSKRITNLSERLMELRVFVEAALDFPDEELELLSEGELEGRLAATKASFDAVLNEMTQGRLLREGIKVVIVGQPNVGKSSLLNVLAGREAAIVTEVPGTTRDPLREHIIVHGMPLHLVDTAGLHTATDAIEREGMKRTWQESGAAQVVLLVTDDRSGVTEKDREIAAALPPEIRLIVVLNKCDLSGRAPAVAEHRLGHTIRISAKTGAGIDLLRDHIAEHSGRLNAEGAFTARRRHIEALAGASSALTTAQTRWQQDRAAELLADELRRAQAALGAITGEVSADDVLGEIFGSFCIGK